MEDPGGRNWVPDFLGLTSPPHPRRKNEAYKMRLFFSLSPSLFYEPESWGENQFTSRPENRKKKKSWSWMEMKTLG